MTFIDQYERYLRRANRARDNAEHATSPTERHYWTASANYWFSRLGAPITDSRPEHRAKQVAFFYSQRYSI